MQLVSSSKLPGQITLHLIFALCTGFQLMLESNSKSLLFASVQLLLLAVSTFLICSRSTGRVYLSDLFKIYSPSRRFQFFADSSIPCIPCVDTKSRCAHSLSYNAPTLWNTLPKATGISQSAAFFKLALKTHPFPT